MKKLTTPYLLLAAGLLLGTAAAAPAADDTGWYLEAQAGSAAFDTQLGRARAKFFDDDDTAAGVEVGYNLNQHLAVQVGTHELGEFIGTGALCPENAEFCIEAFIDALIQAFPEVDPLLLGLCATDPCDFAAVPLTAEVSAYSLAVMPKLPLGERLTLRGRLGVLFWETDISAGFGLGKFETFSGEEFVAGLGMEVGLIERLSAIAEYRTTGFDLDILSAGVVWRFN